MIMLPQLSKTIEKDKINDEEEIFANNFANNQLINKEEYDVLKCDAQCDFLHMTNKKIREFFPSYSEYQDYHPHLTIAYLNKGVCDKFCKEIFEICRVKIKKLGVKIFLFLTPNFYLLIDYIIL